MHTANLLIISDPENGLYAPLSLLLSRSAPPGVTLYHPRPAVHLSGGGVYSWYWTLHLDCLQMLHTMNIRPENIPELEAIINSYLWQVGLLIVDFTITKIDYAYNVQISDPVVCDALFSALQLSPKQADYLIRRAKYETSIYAKSKSLKSKSRAFQVYDKEAERRARGIVPESYEADVIRMEHQIRKDHLAFQRKKGIPRTWESWMNWNRRTEYLQRGFKFVQYGDFYSLSAARDLIYSSNGYKADVQKKMDKYISIISNGGMDALKTVRGFTSHNTRNDFNQKLARIGVNLLTLDAQYGIDHIPMPFDLS